MNLGNVNLYSILSIRKWLIFIESKYVYYFLRFRWRQKSILVGKNTRFFGTPLIVNRAGGLISIGSDSVLCSKTADTALGVAHRVVIRTVSDNAQIEIGNNVKVSGVTICSASKIFIGDRTVIGADTWIVDTDFHSMDAIMRASKADSLGAVTKPVTIGEDVFIGGRVIILKGVQIGNGSIIGAGSVVTRSFPSGSIIGGNPAKLLSV